MFSTCVSWESYCSRCFIKRMNLLLIHRQCLFSGVLFVSREEHERQGSGWWLVRRPYNKTIITYGDLLNITIYSTRSRWYRTHHMNTPYDTLTTWTHHRNCILSFFSSFYAIPPLTFTATNNLAKVTFGKQAFLGVKFNFGKM